MGASVKVAPDAQKKEKKVNSGQVMFSEEIYNYWPLNSVDKSLVKHRFSLHNLLRYWRSSRYV